MTGQTPRNTDQEAWADPFSMNMHFQLNLTSGEHVVAAKLRIYKLPQNLTSSLPSTSGSSVVDEQEEEDEKKIRISVYYYTKTLRKHRGEVTGHMIIFSFCYVSFTLFLFSCRIEKKNSPFVQPPPHHHHPITTNPLPPTPKKDSTSLNPPNLFS